ncbi:MAG: hypothetical protein K9L30_16470 [Desulfobacterales bacterium]|nr:hypothetical protein [Desulfobacterales bacterium]
MGSNTSRKTKTRAWFAVYFVVVLSPLLFPPFLKSLNRVEPFIGPFPFIIFVMLLVSMLVSAGLFVLYKIEEKRGDLL